MRVKRTSVYPKKFLNNFSTLVMHSCGKLATTINFRIAISIIKLAYLHYIQLIVFVPKIQHSANITMVYWSWCGRSGRSVTVGRRSIASQATVHRETKFKYLYEFSPPVQNKVGRKWYTCRKTRRRGKLWIHPQQFHTVLHSEGKRASSTLSTSPHPLL